MAVLLSMAVIVYLSMALPGHCSCLKPKLCKSNAFVELSNSHPPICTLHLLRCSWQLACCSYSRGFSQHPQERTTWRGPEECGCPLLSAAHQAPLQEQWWWCDICIAFWLPWKWMLLGLGPCSLTSWCRWDVLHITVNETQNILSIINIISYSCICVQFDSWHSTSDSSTGYGPTSLLHDWAM